MGGRPRMSCGNRRAARPVPCGWRMEEPTWSSAMSGGNRRRNAARWAARRHCRRRRRGRGVCCGSLVRRRRFAGRERMTSGRAGQHFEGGRCWRCGQGSGCSAPGKSARTAAERQAALEGLLGGAAIELGGGVVAECSYAPRGVRARGRAIPGGPSDRQAQGGRQRGWGGRGDATEDAEAGRGAAGEGPEVTHGARSAAVGC